MFKVTFVLIRGLILLYNYRHEVDVGFKDIFQNVEPMSYVQRDET